MVTTTGSTLDPSVWATLTHLAKLPFSLKYGWFLDQASALVTPYDTLHVHFKVNRPRLVVEALENLSSLQVNALCATTRFEFVGEHARDAGAVQREWYLLVAHGLLSPATGFLMFVLTHDTVDDLALTFSATECDGHGRVLEVDLVDEGRRIPVTEDNKALYVQRMICYFTLKGIEYTPGRYPVVHACYNRIDLPLYPTKALLQEALTMVLLSDPTGFTIE
ncbi:hypothetical protein DYB32_008318 [Aphanomyces invadans]|uniref:HECT-type E3 ubiquitin transferase n=1 Tax=Aphanomyces invadans TaxID=157072 RepID=A0A418ALJ3_9STRA|nr:hypothetical protein DYB32_008318 [Aphanomyces invadans]